MRKKRGSKRFISLAMGLCLLSNMAAAPAWAAGGGLQGQTYFTDTDNWGGNGVGSTPADGDLDYSSPSRIKNGDAKYPIEFKLTNVDKQPVKSAHLLVRAFDVDEYDGTSGTGEWDRIYFSSNAADLQLGAPYTPWPASWGAADEYKKELPQANYLGALSGNNEKWNTTVLQVDPSLITAANTDYYAALSTHHYYKAGNFNPNWVVEVDWGQLVIDGGIRQTGELTKGNFHIVDGKMVVDTGFLPKISGNFAMEVSLIEKVKDADGTVNEQNLDTAAKRFLSSAAGTEQSWTGIELGSGLDPAKEYSVNIILFDDRGGAVTAANPIDPGMAEQIYMTSTLKDIEKDGAQYLPTPFNADEFKDKFAKLDSSEKPESLSKVKIVTLPDPARGRLVLDDGTNPPTDVTLVQEIDVLDLNKLKFVPVNADGGFTGSASFKWNGTSDGTDYELFDGNVTITANAAPTVDPITKSVNKGTDVVFSPDDFTGTKFIDPENGPLNKIQVLSLPDPAKGKLMLGAVEVTVGQEIPAASLNQLKFVPAAGQTGTVTFDWNGSDGVQYAQTPKKVTVTINTPPVLGNVTKTGLAGTVISFNGADFANSPRYTDADGDELQKVSITLPGTFAGQGTLWYTSVSGATYLNPGTTQTISKSELDSLKFKPAAGLPNGSTVTFPWVGNDGKQNAEASALVSISYNGLPVAQPLAAGSEEGTPSITIVLKGSDLETVTGLVYGIASQPHKGTLTPAPDNNPDGDKWIYTPNAGFTGVDSFTYTVTDADGQQSAPATVSIKVNKSLDGWAGSKAQGDASMVKVIPGQLLPLSAVSSVDAEKVTATVNGTTVSLNLTNPTTYMTDGFTKWETTTFKLSEDTVPGIYSVSFAAQAADSTLLPAEPNSRLADNKFEVPAPAVLKLAANPAKILADGKSTSTLTAVLTDKEGNPIAGSEVVFSAPAGQGSFVGPDRAITDSQGRASVIFKSAKISGVEEHQIPVKATVLDIAKGVSAKDEIELTFLPPTINGIITSGTNHEPVAGATVRVTLDLNGDGLIQPGVDFDQTVTTQANGSYSLPVPEGDKEYTLEFTQNVTIGGVQTPVTYKQLAKVGTVEGSGDDSFDSEETVTGMVLFKKQDGTSSLFNSDMLSKMKVYMKDANGNYLMENGSPKVYALQNQGVFNVEGLTKGETYSLEVSYEIEPGKEIVVRRSTVKVTADGEMNISLELVDPYGKITDAYTHSPIQGAKVALYYADTQRNRDNGRTPNTGVTLPAISDFAPNNNQSPVQLSDAAGLYAYMVYPYADYYIVVTKDGYISQTSETINVEKDIVQRNFELTPIRKSSHSSGGGSASVPTPDVSLNLSVDKNLVKEGDSSIITLDYKNLASTTLSEGQISVTVPEAAVVVNANGGKVDGRTITWNVSDLAAGAAGSLKLEVKWNQLSQADKEFDFPAQFSVGSGDAEAVKASSAAKVKVYSDRYGHLSHQRYILGYPDGQFKPDRPLTRAELAAIVSRLTDNNHLSEPLNYSDVTESHWAANYIKIGTKYGYFNGFEGGTFRPDAPVTRGELASVMSRFLKLNVSKAGEAHFTDVEGYWAADAIEALYRGKYVSGYPDGTFKPQNNIIRSEAVTLINRMLYRGPLHGLAPQFPDVPESHWAEGDVQEATVSHESTRNNDGSEAWQKSLNDEVK
ncbi:S-layer homology domain-containing protein [Paenibacillus rigui]|uniref:Uncharacterized protein n=1 Tax=Paenibacillus rigui TaxID=554312 RepID=A0A229UQB3_9BACL|nr:S-layer homology domain-containing protein [Paenibacillus rigui]OXM85415.1 hypothetical protein CF651_15505 [Paenibacillus rigui]